MEGDVLASSDVLCLLTAHVACIAGVCVPGLAARLLVCDGQPQSHLVDAHWCAVLTLCAVILSDASAAGDKTYVRDTFLFVILIITGWRCVLAFTAVFPELTGVAVL